MTIADLSARLRYDVKLLNKRDDNTVADITWAYDVDRKFVMDAVQELLVKKEKDTEGAYDGEIIIRPTRPLTTPYRPYNGGECEEDVVDGGGRIVGHISSAGGVRADGRATTNHSIQLSDGSTFPAEATTGVRNRAEYNSPGIGSLAQKILDKFYRHKKKPFIKGGEFTLDELLGE